MGTANFNKFTHILPPLKITPVKGSTAGTFTVTGIATADKILSASKIEFGTDGDIYTVVDLTSEFSISAANTVTNASGTNSTDALLLILWADYDRSS